MDHIYQTDLALIHDQGFAALSESAAPLLVDKLQKRGLHKGLIVELGCGSGIASDYFSKAGFDVIGVDASETLVKLARQRVTDGDFRVGSFIDLNIPPCVAVTAIGEVFNYTADHRNNEQVLEQVIQKIANALIPDGVFLFDMASPDRCQSAKQSFTQHENWTVLSESVCDDALEILTRIITTFRKEGEVYYKTTETHTLMLVSPDNILKMLQQSGFYVEMTDEYGTMPLPKGLHAFIAGKLR